VTFQKLPVNAPLWKNVEDESRSVVSEDRRDVMKDALGTTIKRPCLSLFNDDLDEVTDGIFYWPEKDMVYFVNDTNLYSLAENGTVTLIGSSLFGSGTHTTWAESPDLTLVTTGATRKLFAANGNKVVKYDGSTASILSGSNTPVQSSHIIMFDTYLLSNEMSDPKWEETIIRSKVADPETWEGAYFSAENHPDKLQAIHSEWDEIAAFGEHSIEPFYNDGSTPFSTIPGANIGKDGGTLSPWTIKVLDNAYFLLNAQRRVIRIDGRQPTVLSHAIGNLLEGNIDYANAEADVLELNDRAFYILTVNDRTFVYDTLLKEWISEWSWWNKTLGKYERFRGRNIITVEQWGVTLCTDWENGNIYKLSENVYQDAGSEVRSSVITGLIDHGTSLEKESNELRLRIKRGQATKTATTDISPKMQIRWRDNGSKKWSNYRVIDLGFYGDDEIYRSLVQLGSYISRQWEFIVTDNVPFSIVDVEEDVNILT